MSYEVAFQLFIRVSALSFGAWLMMLALRRRSGSFRAAAAGCGLLTCVLVPALMPLAKTAPSEPGVLQGEVPLHLMSPVQTSSSSDSPVAAASQETAFEAATLSPEMIALVVFMIGFGLAVIRIGVGAARAAAISERGRGATLLGFPVRISEEPVSPMTVMVRTVVVPAAVAAWPEAQIRPILEHEMAHARRLDAVTMFLSSFVCAAFWPVPFVWLLRGELVRAIEDAADDQVLTQNIDALTYAETLGAACKAFRAPAYQVPTFARKPMITSRIKRTLMPAVDRRRIGRLGGSSLAALAILAAGASAYGILENEPAVPAQTGKATSAQVEIVQLQTMDAQPVYWKPDGTRIPARSAITKGHGLKANPDDVVVWARVRDPEQNAMLWIVNAGSFSTNGGSGFWKDGWWYAASRIYVGKRKLPEKSGMRAQAAVGKYRSLGDYLTASMIAKGQGKDKRVSVGENYVVVKWGTGPFAWQKWNGSKPAGREAETESFFVDVEVRRNLDEGGHAFHTALKDPEQKYQSSISSISTLKDEFNAYRFWIKAKPEDIKRLWLETRPYDYPEFRDVALRPKK